MALTRVDLVGNGVQTVYTVPFTLGYLQKSHVYVYLATDRFKDQLDYTWLNDTQVVVNPPVANGVEFHIRRVVPRGEPVNDYESGAILSDENLDDSFLQELMILEEIEDGYIVPEGAFKLNSDLDMQGNKVVNVGTATNDGDAINRKTFIDTFRTAAVSGGSIISEDAPDIKVHGQRWTRCSDMISFIWYEDADGGQWVEDKPSMGAKRNEQRIPTTVAIVATGAYTVGEYLELTDRASAKFNIELALGRVPNGYDIIYAGNGNVAVLSESKNRINPLWLGSDENYAIMCNAAISIMKAQVTNGGILLVDGRRNITTEIFLPSYVEIEGTGEVSTTITATNCNGIVRVSNCRNSKVSKLTLTSINNNAGSYSGISHNLINGGEGNHDSNLSINLFTYGYRMGNLWWNNTIEDVRANSCGTSLYHDGTDGLSINNFVRKFYSNEPTSRGMRIGSLKNTMFLLCNFGGHPTLTTQYVSIFGSNANRVTFMGCNFESINLAQDEGACEVWSGSFVRFSGCTFVANKLAAGATRAFEIKARDSARVVIDDCSQISSLVRSFYATNTSVIRYSECNLTGGTLAVSTARVTNLDARDVKFKGTTTGVKSGDFLATGSLVAVSQFFATVVTSAGTYPTVICATDEKSSNGSVKLRFVNISDGVQNNATHTIDWMAL